MRKTRSLEQWRNIIEEQQASNLTITEFCQQRALSKTTFYAARSKLNESSGSFVRAKITKHVDITEQQQPITLTVGKVKVSLPPTTPATYLSQLLREFAL
ncbi:MULTISPECIES: IS66 family insertion sequence element accessory protein TnpB [unclassified Pseudoalteromonas]|uniref:IS66 family insertion sequence element accessory protein TnpA n=1 Tax=unclassified Pseudoalteromonas TaxID=194690 RepID=UPI0025B3E1D4|nr:MULTISPECIES: IS66 family insertion sequence element accessory protein TnpB [unclassified Pseudoalteromonas]MDN3380994.1 IS66 family insertion sequence element accessory protein TnpB [Pseudoalteromonas sp. APC 3893]MDN3389384.1 IS66 family insertion sequence element accessory protein TnpB [Pseudoalteromonas sp. APC 4017]